MRDRCPICGSAGTFNVEERMEMRELRDDEWDVDEPWRIMPTGLQCYEGPELLHIYRGPTRVWPVDEIQNGEPWAYDGDPPLAAIMRDFWESYDA